MACCNEPVVADVERGAGRRPGPFFTIEFLIGAERPRLGVYVIGNLNAIQCRNRRRHAVSRPFKTVLASGVMGEQHKSRCLDVRWVAFFVSGFVSAACFGQVAPEPTAAEESRSNGKDAEPAAGPLQHVREEADAPAVRSPSEETSDEREPPEQRDGIEPSPQSTELSDTCSAAKARQHMAGEPPGGWWKTFAEDQSELVVQRLVGAEMAPRVEMKVFGMGKDSRVSRAYKQSFGLIRMCYVVALAKDPKEHGHLVLQVGQAQPNLTCSVDVVDSTVSEHLTQCIRSELDEWKNNGGATGVFEVVMTFHPS